MTSFRMALFLVIWAIFLTLNSASADQLRWTVNELSILFPLPEKGEREAIIPLSSVLDLKTYARMIGQAVDDPKFKFHIEPIISPAHSSHRPKGTTEFAWMNLISVRVDPCFRMNFEDRCRRQIRMVWQPLEIGRRGKLLTVDAAFHTFYDLDENVFHDFLGGLQALNSPYRKLFESFPELSVHPILLSEGLRSEYAQGLRNLILSTVSKGKSARIAVMQLDNFEETWTFFAQDQIGDQKFVVSKIPNFPKKQIEVM